MPVDEPHTPTILVVDDEPALRAFAEVVLEDLGYVAMLAENGRAAVQLLLQDPDAVAAVLLDMTMPGMRPEETFRLMKEIRADLPVLILSGDLESTVRERFGEGSISGYIPKPYTDSELGSALTEVLSRCAASPLPSFNLARISQDELEAIKQQYLAKCRSEVEGIAAALARRDFRALQAIGHSLKGSAGCVGLPALSQLGRVLESAALDSDQAACETQLQLLKQSLT